MKNKQEVLDNVSKVIDAMMAENNKVHGWKVLRELGFGLKSSAAFVDMLHEMDLDIERTKER